VAERVLLGCASIGACFCTGRCKRTAEEQAEHERRERQGFGLSGSFEPARFLKPDYSAFLKPAPPLEPPIPVEDEA
jgi:hypothetical protein